MCQPKDRRKEVSTLSIACCRRIWLERSSRNFEGIQSTEQGVVDKIKQEFHLWGLARQPAERREE